MTHFHISFLEHDDIQESAKVLSLALLNTPSCKSKTEVSWYYLIGFNKESIAKLHVLVIMNVQNAVV